MGGHQKKERTAIGGVETVGSLPGERESMNDGTGGSETCVSGMHLKRV